MSDELRDEARAALREEPEIESLQVRRSGGRREVSDLQDRRDRELLGRVAAGNESSFAEFYGRYASAAAGLAFGVIGDGSLAEEVLQEVFLSVWRSPGSYDPARGSVRSWFLAQIHHRAVDVVRREEAERRRAVRQSAPSVDDSLDDVIERGWMESRRTRVRAALGALPAPQVEVLELAYFRGMTQSQIAKDTGIPLGTVKSRTLAAMRGLRAALGTAES